eukprot:364962-Chlamydomonas_euryale.AAC.7
MKDYNSHRLTGYSRLHQNIQPEPEEEECLRRAGGPTSKHPTKQTCPKTSCCAPCGCEAGARPQ